MEVMFGMQWQHFHDVGTHRCQCGMVVKNWKQNWPCWPHAWVMTEVVTRSKKCTTTDRILRVVQNIHGDTIILDFLVCICILTGSSGGI